MKKRGFTLIELLAVIVVLAIIALIATPIVMNVIKNASAGAAERSADNYVKAVETLIATEKLDGTPVADGEYTIGSTGKLTKDGNSYEVEVSGTKPVGGTIVVKDGQVVKDSSTISYTDYTVTFKDGVAEAVEKGSTLALCTAIAPVAQPLFDYMDTGLMVDTVVGVQATEDAPYAAGAVYQCNLGDGDRIFYVVKATEDTVSLLMEENIGNTVAWSESGEYSEGPVTANAYLKSQTSGWIKLDESQIGLPACETDECEIGLFDWARINLDSVNSHGYWLSTTFMTDEMVPVGVHEIGVSYGDFTTSDYFGIRPVITIPKANMSL